MSETKLQSSVRKSVGPLAALVTLVAAVAAGATMLQRSWLRWPDVIIDFGRELYVPWRIADHGDVLYRDIAYFNGPLSAYFNAAVESLFGANLLTLVYANTAIAALLAILIYAVLTRVAGRASAFAGVLTFILLFACGQLVAVGNYNFICPYSHEITHGVVLAFLAMWLLLRYLDAGGRVWLVSAGVAVGLAFLTKVEVSFAAVLVGVTGVALSAWAVEPDMRRRAMAFALFFAGLLTPPIVAFVLLAAQIGGADAFRGVLGSWWYAFDARLHAMPFFHDAMGTDDTTGNLRRLATWAGVYAAAMAGIAGVARLAGKRTGVALAAAAVVSSVVVALLWWQRAHIDWLAAFRPLPALVCVAGVVLVVQWFVRRGNADRRRTAGRLIFVIFAGAMLGKILLNAGIARYGFALALPATLVLVAVLFDWLPSIAARVGGSALVVRCMAAGVWIVLVVVYVGQSRGWYEQKTTMVAAGRDAFRARNIGEAIDLTLEQIKTHVPQDATLMVLPEGMMFNYLAKRSTPTPFLNAMPAELIYFGEDRVAQALREHPPDYILLLNRDTSEYGPTLFGRDYGQDLYQWIEGNYRAVQPPVGVMPLAREDQAGYYGALLLRRRAG